MGQKRTASEARRGASLAKPQPEKVSHAPTGRSSADKLVCHSSQDSRACLLTCQICSPLSAWHTIDLPALKLPDQVQPIPQDAIQSLHAYGVELLESDNKVYSAANVSSSASNKFMSSIMSSGTLEDKISALTLMVQESPLHTMKSLDALLNLAKKKSRNQALMALAAIKDLFAQGNVLPNRKMVAFARQPGLSVLYHTPMRHWKSGDALPGGLDKTHLITWAFEDWLKRQYFELLKILESWCADEVEFARARAVTCVWELLRDKPEQEENLLRLLVNKLGDTANKVASRTSHLLLQLQNTHPAMKLIVINAIESDCLFRPGQNLLAKYYAIITLNQTILGRKESELASKLLEIYFALFVQLLKLPKLDSAAAVVAPAAPQQGGGGKAGKMAAKKAKAAERVDVADEQLREKMVAQVLAGVNRAFPFADVDDPKFERQMETIFRVAHSSNFNTGIQALMLIQRISASKQYSADRFYRTLYESLLDPRLLTSSKQSLYLNLLFRALKADVNARRVQAFVKRLLQIINLHEPPFVVGVLFLISELKKTFPALNNMVREPELDIDDQEEHFVDVPDSESAAPALRQPTVSADTYDARKRDPEHSNADKSALWDVLPLRNHFHPSVSLFAESLLYEKAPPAKPDPALHSLMHFLDRFVYRNPKSKSGATRGASIMQPLAGSDAADRLVKASAVSRSKAPVNSEAFWSQNISKISPDEVFFHKYFGQTSKKPAAKKQKSVDPDDSASDDSEEDDIWKALVKSNRDIEGPDEEDDISVDDLASAYSDSASEADSAPDENGDDDGDVEIADFPDEEDEDEADQAGALDDDDESGLDFDDEDDVLGDDDEVPLAADADDIAAEDDPKKKRKKIKHLPTFASAEDYAAMLDNEPDED